MKITSNFKSELVKIIYKEELQGDAKSVSSRVILLEFSCYLENYLWRNFDPELSSFDHIMSILLMVNEKFRSGLPAWETFHTREEVFPEFVKAVCELPFGEKTGKRAMTDEEKGSYILFLINCFQSLENKLVRESFLKLVSLPLWKKVTPKRLQIELEKYPQLRRHWDHLVTKDNKEPTAPPKNKKQKTAAKDKGKDKGGGGSPSDNVLADLESTFLPDLVNLFLETLEAVTESALLSRALLLFIERCVELLVDLISQLPTRRFLRLVLLDAQVAVRCKLAVLGKRPEGRLFKQMLQMFMFYMRFEINDQTGMPMSQRDMTDMHYQRLQLVQRIAFKYYGTSAGDPLRDFALTGIGSISSRDALERHFGRLPLDTLKTICEKLCILPPHEGGEDGLEGTVSLSRELLLEVLVTNHEKHRSQIDVFNHMPLYPTEELLWDQNLVPFGQYNGETVLALPKLNLQFLTFHDYLLRSFNLFRLESSYEIREDMNDVIKRVDAKRLIDGRTIFNGWARMAVPIDSFSVTEVKKPNIGETKPAEVKAELVFELSQFSGYIREEWDQLREHDVLFLVTIRATAMETSAGIRGYEEAQQKKGSKEGGHSKEEDSTFPQRHGVVAVRGCEVVQLKDEEGVALNDMSGKPDERAGGASGNKRTVTVRLDSAQYQQDMADANDVYDTVNLLVRRKAKENNFKAVLETIRELMNVAAVNKAVPTWLHDVFLGYGDPASASFGRVNDGEQQPTLDFKDTFVHADHARSSFPEEDYDSVVFEDEQGDAITNSSPPPPYRVCFRTAAESSGKGKEAAKGKETVVITPYIPVNPGPYPQDQPRKNAVKFTPVQTRAIRAGLNHGLTMVVGPPGTGKTDVAVQIISNLYANFPGQRIIVVTHSNQALNDLFEKIMERDIDERHLLRLGSGEKDLSTEKDFSKWGRVNYTLQRRLQLLAEVERLSTSLGAGDDAGYTCESASHFELSQVQARREKFEADLSAAERTDAVVAELFPFTAYFSTAPQLFRRRGYAEDYEIAQGCFRHLEKLFDELRDYRAFELLRSGSQRADYLLTKQARIVAMTCTHAALVRPRLVKLGFKFDNMLMEESAQILEVETFIPMLLQNHDKVEGCRLKRVILIGDHHQLPPVVKNMAFQKYGHLDQSLFARFVRLGVPTIDLNLQGRARPAIARLYSWRYKDLGDLEAVTAGRAGGGAGEAKGKKGQQGGEGGSASASESGAEGGRGYGTPNAGFAHDFQLVDVGDFQGRGESSPTAFFYQNLGEAEYVVATYQVWVGVGVGRGVGGVS
jgi:intron-binding protein aquarius